MIIKEGDIAVDFRAGHYLFDVYLFVDGVGGGAAAGAEDQRGGAVGDPGGVRAVRRGGQLDLGACVAAADLKRAEAEGIGGGGVEWGRFKLKAAVAYAQ